MSTKAQRNSTESAASWRISDDLAEEIKATARASIMEIATTLIPAEYTPGRLKNGSVDFGRRRDARTFTVTISGPYAGWVKDWRGQNMDPVALAQEYGGCGSYPEALRWLADQLRIPTGDNLSDAERAQFERETARKRAERTAERERTAAAQERLTAKSLKKARAEAAAYWQASLAIEPGSPADRYLTETRKIPRPVEGWPASALRFHPGDSALVVGLSDASGAVLTAQRIFLTPDGRKAPNLPKKLLPGSSKDLFFKLPARATAPYVTNGPAYAEPIAATEGPETALTVWVASGLETWASIGAGAAITPPPDRPIIHCRDDDLTPAEAKKPGDDAAWKAAEKAAAEWEEQGHAVFTVWPWEARQTDKTDLNDTLQAEGISAVRRRINEALAAYSARLAALPYYPPVEEARANVRATIRDWMAGSDPAKRILLLPVGVGIGKTQGVIEVALQNRASNPNAPPVVIAVPAHRLGEDILSKIQSLAPHLTVRVWHGRNREGMCANLDEVSIVQSAGLSTMSTLCKKICPFKDGCPYLKQAESRADVWIVTHAHLFMTPPAAINTPERLIVDESFYRSGLTGTEGIGSPVSALSVNFRTALADVPATYDDKGNAEVALSDLADMLSQNASSSGTPVTAFAEARFTEGRLCRDIENLSNLHTVAQQSVGNNMARIKDLVGSLRVIRRALGLLREMLRTIRAGAQSTPRITGYTDKEGAQRYRLTNRRDVHPRWLGATDETPATPVLLLDATACVNAVREYFPSVFVAPQIQAQTPYARFIWMRGQGWGHSQQKRAVAADLAGERGRIDGQNVEGLRWTLWRHWLANGRRPLLAVMAQALREHIEAQPSGFLPPDCGLLHHGAAQGINAFENVRTVLIFGRLLPETDAIERQAAALTGSPVQQLPEEQLANGKKCRRPVVINVPRVLPNASAVTVTRYSHPDLTCDALLQDYVQGNLVQAAGRGRAVNRTATDPLEVFIYADTYPEALPLDAALNTRAPSPAERMALSQAMQTGRAEDLGVVLFSATDAARAYDQLWNSERAAIKAFQAEKQKCPKLYNYIFIGVGAPVLAGQNSIPDGFSLCCYQPEGERQKPRFALVSDEQKMGFHGWIETVLQTEVTMQWIEKTPQRPVARRLPTMKRVGSTLGRDMRSLQPTRSLIGSLIALDKSIQALGIDREKAVLARHVSLALGADFLNNEDREYLAWATPLALAFDAARALGGKERVDSLLQDLPPDLQQFVRDNVPWMNHEVGGGLAYLAGVYGAVLPHWANETDFPAWVYEEVGL